MCLSSLLIHLNSIKVLISIILHQMNAGLVSRRDFLKKKYIKNHTVHKRLTGSVINNCIIKYVIKYDLVFVFSLMWSLSITSNMFRWRNTCSYFEEHTIINSSFLQRSNVSGRDTSSSKTTRCC